MADPLSNRPELVLTEAEVSRILETAATLDAKKGGITIPELLRVGEEAGFSPEVMTAAVEQILLARGESLGTPGAVATGAASVLPIGSAGGALQVPRWKRVIASALAGGTAGALARLLGPEPWGSGEVNMIFAALMLAVMAFRAFQHRRDGNQEAFHLEIAGLWTGFTTGWMLMHGSLFSDMVYSTLWLWLGCSAVGGVFFRLGGPKQDRPMLLPLQTEQPDGE